MKCWSIDLSIRLSCCQQWLVGLLLSSLQARDIEVSRRQFFQERFSLGHVLAFGSRMDSPAAGLTSAWVMRPFITVLCPLVCSQFSGCLQLLEISWNFEIASGTPGNLLEFS